MRWIIEKSLDSMKKTYYLVCGKMWKKSTLFVLGAKSEGKHILRFADSWHWLFDSYVWDGEVLMPRALLKRITHKSISHKPWHTYQMIEELRWQMLLMKRIVCDRKLFKKNWKKNWSLKATVKAAEDQRRNMQELFILTVASLGIGNQ